MDKESYQADVEEYEDDGLHVNRPLGRMRHSVKSEDRVTICEVASCRKTKFSGSVLLKDLRRSQSGWITGAAAKANGIPGSGAPQGWRKGLGHDGRIDGLSESGDGMRYGDAPGGAGKNAPRAHQEKCPPYPPPAYGVSCRARAGGCLPYRTYEMRIRPQKLGPPLLR
jgi:hypothetical protein